RIAIQTPPLFILCNMPPLGRAFRKIDLSLRNCKDLPPFHAAILQQGNAPLQILPPEFAHPAA
ncbi:MAG: hypothetical protein LUD50_03600, partial [Clostridia bacterium]|nr:hypothetical protein [Clostridia bacterium]